MDKVELKRIKKRALYLLEQKDRLEDQLVAAVLGGDAADLLNLLEYIDRLERRLRPTIAYERLMSEAEIAILLQKKESGHA